MYLCCILTFLAMFDIIESTKIAAANFYGNPI
jgi:hypothetical protein